MAAVVRGTFDKRSGSTMTIVIHDSIASYRNQQNLILNE